MTSRSEQLLYVQAISLFRVQDILFLGLSRVNIRSWSLGFFSQQPHISWTLVLFSLWFSTLGTCFTVKKIIIWNLSICKLIKSGSLVKNTTTGDANAIPPVEWERYNKWGLGFYRRKISKFTSVWLELIEKHSSRKGEVAWLSVRGEWGAT